MPSHSCVARATLATATLLLLSACVPGAGPLSALAPASMRVRPILDGAIKIGAPPGYCIEPSGVLQTENSALSLIGRCSTGKATAAPAILTAAVGEAGSGQGIVGSGPELATFFQSADGRAALSRSGKARTVKLLEAIGVGDAFLMRITDTSPNPYGPGQDESWRAVLGLSGRLVTLTVTGTVDTPLDRDAGRALMDAFVTAMTAANPPRKR